MSATNGGNRLDRIEKSMEAASKRMDRADARMDRADALGRRTDKRLDHLVRLGVTEARDQRKRSRDLDDAITKLAAAQVVTEEKLQNFISSIGQGSNGKHK